MFWKVGRIQCPVLLVNGDDDQNWATVESAEDVRKKEKKYLPYLFNLKPPMIEQD